MSWQRSGELLIMVIFGGIGTLNGAIVGAAAFLLTEEWLSGITEHWKVIFGPLLVLVAVFARGGLIGVAATAAEDDPWLSPCCASRTSRKNFGGLRVTDDVTLDVHAGRAARRDRAERRRQDHADQPDFRAARARRRPHRVRRRGRDRAAGATRARAARARALVPDHLDPAALLGAGECRARRAGAHGLELPLLRPRGRRGRTERRRAGGARAGRACRARAMCRPASCRTARSARSSLRSRSRWSRSCCCSTSRWPAPGATRPSGWSRRCAP